MTSAVKSFSRWTSRRQSTDGIPPTAIPAPRRVPTWPGETVVNEDPFWAPIADEIPARPLPPEDRNLLTARPAGAAGNAMLATLALLAAAARRPGCRILAVSAAFEYEVAVGQNLAMLADQDHMAVTR